MRFPGRFAEQFLAGMLDKVSLSFLVDDLTIRQGGVAANIAFGLASLGLRPILVGSVGADYAARRAELERLGVDCRLRVSDEQLTARFVCTTDADQCQIASFSPGAMREASRINLLEVLGPEPPDLVLIGADDPAAMQAHAAACRRAGWRFVADPSQQIALMSGAELLSFIRGADLLMTNEYELELLCAKIGLGAGELRTLVGARITTLGANGVQIEGPGIGLVTVPAARVDRHVDPTGLGDAFRAGMVAMMARGLPMDQAAAVGCQLAACVLESSGGQDYDIDPAAFTARLELSYGQDLAGRVRSGLSWPAATLDDLRTT
nr:PfkB family carbohydrate kinase [Nucisporomicrobium flavum]